MKIPKNLKAKAQPPYHFKGNLLNKKKIVTFLRRKRPTDIHCIGLTQKKGK